MIIDPHFLSHWKTQALIGAVGAGPALTAILGLWGHCQTCKEWEFALTPRMLAGICRFTGDAEMLLKEMETCGFLDKKEGVWEVHGWAEKNAQLLNAWKVGKSGGRPPKNPRVSKNAEKGTSSNPTDNPQKTHGPPDKIREDKIREEENTDTLAEGGETELPELLPSLSDAFDAFWQKYPRRAAKADALKAFKGLKLARKLPELLAAIERFERTEWSGQEMQFIPLPATWLRGQRWEDETLAAPPKAAAKPGFAPGKKDGAEIDTSGWLEVGQALYPEGNFPEKFTDLPMHLRREIVAEIKRRKGGEAA